MSMATRFSAFTTVMEALPSPHSRPRCRLRPSSVLSTLSLSILRTSLQKSLVVHCAPPISPWTQLFATILRTSCPFFLNALLFPHCPIWAASCSSACPIAGFAFAVARIDLFDVVHIIRLGTGEESGSTAVSLLLTPTHLVIANCGDSRCVVYGSDGVRFASVDHKPTDPAELLRIQSAGGYVVGGRVCGSLAVSRALGDFFFKRATDLSDEEQQVSAEADITILERLATDTFVVLACDGIWDVATNEAVGEFVANQLKADTSLDIACEALLDECLRLGSTDNMTAIIVVLPGAPKAVPDFVATALARKSASELADDRLVSGSHRQRFGDEDDDEEDDAQEDDDDEAHEDGRDATKRGTARHRGTQSQEESWDSFVSALKETLAEADIPFRDDSGEDEDDNSDSDEEAPLSVLPDQTRHHRRNQEYHAFELRPHSSREARHRHHHESSASPATALGGSSAVPSTGHYKPSHRIDERPASAARSLGPSSRWTDSSAQPDVQQLSNASLLFKSHFGLQPDDPLSSQEEAVTVSISTLNSERHLSQSEHGDPLMPNAEQARAVSPQAATSTRSATVEEKPTSSVVRTDLHPTVDETSRTGNSSPPAGQNPERSVSSDSNSDAAERCPASQLSHNDLTRLADAIDANPRAELLKESIVRLSSSDAQLNEHTQAELRFLAHEIKARESERVQGEAYDDSDEDEDVESSRVPRGTLEPFTEREDEASPSHIDLPSSTLATNPP
eukprot:m.662404 g.662404  ORF g.662404 m.662404 type:complete len:737 (-) comp58475_c0_seq2:249-2459(-)